MLAYVRTGIAPNAEFLYPKGAAGYLGIGGRVVDTGNDVSNGESRHLSRGNEAEAEVECDTEDDGKGQMCHRHGGEGKASEACVETPVPGLGQEG